jgi:hypothetical protein
MVKIVKAEKILQKKSVRLSKLCVEDPILMTLSYLREDPTFFHRELNGVLMNQMLIEL